MATIDDKQTLVQSCTKNLRTIISRSVISDQSEIVHGIQNQLWDGQDSKGEDITPSMQDDPFFKSSKQALSYANWKASITPNPNRNFWAPNLFINGYFWSGMVIDPSTLQIDAANAFGKPIVQKYGEGVFALNASRNEDIIEKLREIIISNIKEGLNL